jgi:hypothetical protein
MGGEGGDKREKEDRGVGGREGKWGSNRQTQTETEKGKITLNPNSLSRFLIPGERTVTVIGDMMEIGDG